MQAMKAVEQVSTSSLVSRLLEPVGRCLTPPVARRLLQLRADPQTQARVAELTEKCNEGRLTPEERSDYEAYVSASTFIAILQAKARALLNQHRHP